MIETLKEELRLLYNKARIAWLKTFTNRVRVAEIKDDQGNVHKVTSVTEEEKLCAHKRIAQVYGTFWHCIDCPDVFFEITYKVALNRLDLFGFLEAMAKHLKAESPLKDDATE